MTRLAQSVRAAFERRRRYRATVAELRALPIDVALDLDLFAEDAPLIARRAVYGA